MKHLQFLFFSLNGISIDPIWGHAIKEDILGIHQSVCDKVQDTQVYFDHMLFFSQSVGLAYQGKDIVFRFVIEYSILKDFGFYLTIFWRLYFCMVKYLSSIILLLP
jgi:hypothetical protein